MRIPELRATTRRRVGFLAVAFLTACTAAAPAATPIPGASSTAPPTATPTPSASPAPTEAPSPSAPASGGRADIAQVVTTDLVMRSAPGTGPDSEIYSPSVTSPMLLYVLEGPVAADGYDWYRVLRFEEFVSDIGLEGTGVGWVAAAGKDGEAWVAPWKGTCPTPTAEDLMWRSSLLALACFGDTELTLDGTVVDCFDSAPDDAPSGFGWCLLEPFGAPPGRLLAGFAFYLETATTELSPGMAVRVTGHYDNPAAQSCADNAWEGLDEPLPEVKVVLCRAKFVATETTPTSPP